MLVVNWKSPSIYNRLALMIRNCQNSLWHGRRGDPSEQVFMNSIFSISSPFSSSLTIPSRPRSVVVLITSRVYFDNRPSPPDQELPISPKRVSINYLLIDLYCSDKLNRFDSDSPSCISLSLRRELVIRNTTQHTLPPPRETQANEWNRMFTNPALLHFHFWLPVTSESHSLFHFSFTCRYGTDDVDRGLIIPGLVKSFD